MSRKRGAISARVPGSVVGGRSPSSSTSSPLSSLASRKRGGFRVFVQLDVPAQRQPLVQVAVVDEQDLALVNDKDGDREVNLLVDVGHAEYTQFNSHTARYHASRAAAAHARLLRPGRP